MGHFMVGGGGAGSTTQKGVTGTGGLCKPLGEDFTFPTLPDSATVLIGGGSVAEADCIRVGPGGGGGCYTDLGNKKDLTLAEIADNVQRVAALTAEAYDARVLTIAIGKNGAWQIRTAGSGLTYDQLISTLAQIQASYIADLIGNKE